MAEEENLDTFEWDLEFKVQVHVWNDSGPSAADWEWNYARDRELQKLQYEVKKPKNI